MRVNTTTAQYKKDKACWCSLKHHLKRAINTTGQAGGLVPSKVRILAMASY